MKTNIKSPQIGSLNHKTKPQTRIKNVQHQGANINANKTLASFGDYKHKNKHATTAQNEEEEQYLLEERTKKEKKHANNGSEKPRRTLESPANSKGNSGEMKILKIKERKQRQR